MSTIDSELKKVNQIISDSIPNTILSGDLKNFVCQKSKLIRARLSLLYLKSRQANINENVFKILAAGEIIHNASLLHDDIIDEASTRRGKSTIGALYNPKLAILSGDYLLSIAVELLESNSSEILQRFKDAIKQMCEAEFKQYFLRSKMPTIEEYISICRGKTAALFSAILQSCAIALDLETETTTEFAENFGVLFQLCNDLDKVSANNDKKNNVNTVIDIIGIEKAKILLDNYKHKLLSLIKDIENNEYKEELEVLIKELC